MLKLPWLAICDIEDSAIERAKEHGKPSNEREDPPRLVEGTITTSWKKAVAPLAIAFLRPDRPLPLTTRRRPLTQKNRLPPGRLHQRV